METKKSMHIKSRSKSFSYAINGIWQLASGEPNAKLHAVATVVVIVGGIIKHLNPTQWIAITFAIGIVWIAEALNTCIEKLCDYCCDMEIHPTIKSIKDIAAAAVLIAAMVSVVIAVLVFFF